MIPKRRTRPKMNVRESSVIRCASHLQWVRGHCCAIAERKVDHIGWWHKCEGQIEAHHVREGANGGTGLKPDDSTAVPLCSRAHADGHARGWQTFEKTWGVDLDKLAAELWAKSPHRIRYQKQRESDA